MVEYLSGERIQDVEYGGDIDTLGSDADGTNTSITLDTTNEKLGTGCYSFNGSSSKVTGWTLGTQPTVWTLAFWFRADSVTNYEGILNSNAHNSGDGFRLELDSNSDLRFLWNGTTGATHVVSTNITQGQWYHLVIQGNQTTNKIISYLDGVASSETSFSDWSDGASTFNNFEFGLGYSTSSERWFTGLIDDFGFWSRAITSTEVSALYNSGTGALVSSLSNKTGLLAYYNFDTSSSTNNATKTLNRDSITNVPANTRYEETDTRKIFRRALGSTTTQANSNDSGNSSLGGGGGNVTEIGAKIFAGHALVGQTLETVIFKQSHIGSPSGYGQVKVYDSSFNTIATSGNSSIAWSALPDQGSGIGDEVSYTFSTPPTIEANYTIAVQGGTFSDGNEVNVIASNADDFSYMSYTLKNSGSWRVYDNSGSYSHRSPYFKFTTGDSWKERNTA